MSNGMEHITDSDVYELVRDLLTSNDQRVSQIHRKIFGDELSDFVERLIKDSHNPPYVASYERKYFGDSIVCAILRAFNEHSSDADSVTGANSQSSWETIVPGDYPLEMPQNHDDVKGIDLQKDVPVYSDWSLFLWVEIVVGFVITFVWALHNEFKKEVVLSVLGDPLYFFSNYPEVMSQIVVCGPGLILFFSCLIAWFMKRNRRKAGSSEPYASCVAKAMLGLLIMVIILFFCPKKI